MRRLLAVGVLLGAVAAASAEPPRTLFVMLDAVPFGLMERLTDPERPGGPLLESFSGPVPLVSSFPSSTSVAAAGLYAPLGLARSPGYEARFFDWRQHRVRGGGPISYFRIDFPWREFFDWSGKGAWRSAVGALWPVRASVSRLRRAIDAFLASDRDQFHAYVEMTDTLAHLEGPAALEPVFQALDELLAAARQRSPEPFRVVLYSDHGIDGGAPLKNVWTPVRQALEGAGLRQRKRLEEPRDVVLTPYGLVSSFEVYTWPAARRETARLLASVEGIDLCVWRSGEDSWMVESRRGSAEIQRSGSGAEWAYRPGTGDPLAYGEVVESLRRSSGGGARAAFPDRLWFEHTVHRHYPDALYRIARAFELVANPASVLCSAERGHMYGLGSAEWAARTTQGALEWTHGALHRPATLGFLVADVPDWRPPPAVRFDRALVGLAVAGEDPAGVRVPPRPPTR